MKKIILALMLILGITKAFASLPLPRIIPDAEPGGAWVASSRAAEELTRQNLENQMLRERIAMMQQQRALMEMQLPDKK